MINLPKGTLVINSGTGETSRVKWANSDHIQFEGGRSCSAKDFPLFYSDSDIVRPGECKEWMSGDYRTKTIDNRDYIV
jgi:hypothetical protein